MPLLYVIAFGLMSLLLFGVQNIMYYFVIVPLVTITLVLINPIFNLIIYLVFVNNRSLHHLIFSGSDNSPS